MKDENLANEVRAEGLREEFYGALDACDWDECRAVLKDLEEMRVSTYELRRQMNTAMEDEKAQSEPEDYSNSTIEDYGL